MDAKSFYKNLKPEDIKPLEEVVKILKEDSLDIFVEGKSVELNHDKQYEAINLSLRGVNPKGYDSSIDKIKELGAEIHEYKVETTDGKPNYDAFVTDKMIKGVNIKFIGATEIILSYKMENKIVGPKIRL